MSRLLALVLVTLWCGCDCAAVVGYRNDAGSPPDGTKDPDGSLPLDDGGGVDAGRDAGLADAGPTELVSAWVVDAGAYSAIAVGPDDLPRILSRHTTPRLSTWTGSEWQTETLPDPGLGIAPDHLRVRVDHSGDAHLAWSLAFHAVYARQVDGGFIVQPFDRDSLLPSLALTGSGSPRLAYVQNGYLSGVVYAVPDGGGWTRELVGGSVYFPPSRDIAADGTAHLAYGDFRTGVEHARQAPDGGWLFETVTSDAPDEEAIIRVTAGGEPIIAFRDGSSRLAVARRDAGTWVVEHPMSAGASGMQLDLALDPAGHPALVFTRDDDLSVWLAQDRGGGWSTRRLSPPDAGGLRPGIAIDSRGRKHVCYSDRFGGGVRYLLVP